MITALAVLGFSAGFTTVHADASIEYATKRVSYADLNLDSDVDAHVFYARVESAAKSVCSGYESRDLKIVMLREGCVDKAIASAVSQTNNSKVIALYTHSKSTSTRLVASR
jgi:UrcA family protein